MKPKYGHGKCKKFCSCSSCEQARNQLKLEESESENAKLRERLDWLERAIRKYGKHISGCNVCHTEDPCNCGLGVFLKTKNET